MPRPLVALNSAIQNTEYKRRHKLTKNNQPEGKSTATCAYHKPAQEVDKMPVSIIIFSHRGCQMGVK